MRKLWALVALALLFPAAAGAKWQGDLRMCGTNGCRTIERHLGHDTWPLLAELSTWPSNAGPPPPSAYYRLTIVPLDSQGRPNVSAQSQPIYLVPTTRLARSDDGAGGAFWTRLRQIPAAIEKAAKVLRPFPAPRVTRVVVGNRVAKDPQSYLRLFRLPAPRVRVPDPAAPRPGAERTMREFAAYWERAQRVYRPVWLTSSRQTPWTDWKTSLWVGRRLDLIMRDGEIVPIPHSLAERVRRGQSLR